MGSVPVKRSVRRPMTSAAPLPPDEFRQRINAFQRGGAKRAIIFLVWFFGGLLALQPLASWADRTGGVSKWASGALLLLFVVHPFVLGRWYGWRSQRRFGLLCPSCNNCLIGLGQDVERTRSCKFCGMIVIAADQPGDKRGIAVD